MAKKRETLGETIRRITKAKKYLKEGNIDKAIETTPCVGCKEKLAKLSQLRKNQKDA